MIEHQPRGAREPMTLELPNYGADRSGLICGYAFSATAPGRPVDTAEAIAWLAGGPREAPDQFLWLHFNLADNASEKWMRRSLALPEAFYEALHEGTRTTRIELADDDLVAVMNDVLFDFAYTASDTSTLWLRVDADTVISARLKPLRSIDRLRESVRGGATFSSPVDLLAHLFRDQADVLVGIVRDAIAKVDRIEDRLLADRLEPRRGDLGALRRVLVRLRRLLAPEPAALFRLLNHPPAWIAEDDLVGLRESTEEFSTVLADMAGLLERIKLLQEEIAAQVNEQNNRSLFLLTVFTVLALPINIIAGLFGMNVGGIPLNQDDHGFWTIVGLVAAFTIPALWLVLRRRRD
jgi:zinc transporter